VSGIKSAEMDATIHGQHTERYIYTLVSQDFRLMFLDADSLLPFVLMPMFVY